jgi:hypothetical protein
MKWVFIFFLLLNIGYFAFEFDQQLAHPAPKAPVSVSDAIPSGVERLKLVSELTEAPRIRPMGRSDEPTGELNEDELMQDLADGTGETVADVAADADGDTDSGGPDVVARIETEAGQQPAGEQPASGADSVRDSDAEIATTDDAELGRCFSVGPFKDQSAGSSLMSWLEEHSAQVTTRNETARKRLFWVYHEPLESAAAARATVQEMVGKGVQDLMMISGGDMANAISLGVFSTQEAVNRRLEEMREQGYEPVVVPQYRDRQEVWLDVQSALDESIARQDLPALSQGVSAATRSCEEIAKLDSAP